MAFLTRKIDSSKFDDGSRTDVYEISDGDRLIGKKTVRHPATGSVVKISYQLGDQSFDNPDAFMTAYLLRLRFSRSILNRLLLKQIGPTSSGIR